MSTPTCYRPPPPDPTESNRIHHARTHNVAFQPRAKPVGRMCVLGQLLPAAGLSRRQHAAAIHDVLLQGQCPRERIQGLIALSYILNRCVENSLEINASIIALHDGKDETKVPRGLAVADTFGIL